MQSKLLKQQKFIYLVYLLPLIFVAFLLFKNIPPAGMLREAYDFKWKPKLISRLYPLNRVSAIQKDGEIYYQDVTNDNVYFDINLPNSLFKTISLSIIFKNPQNLNEILIGGSVGENFSFKNKILSNKILDNLDWSAANKGYLTLFQKKKDYENVDEFLENPPLDKKIAMYNTATAPRAIFKDYRTSEKLIKFPYTLRGKHTALVYIKQENLYLEFEKQDLNFAHGQDAGIVRISNYKNDIVFEKNIEDDSIVDNSSEQREPERMELNVSDLEEGVYKIDFNFNDDVLIKNMQTKNHWFVFKNRIFIADNDIYKQTTKETNLIFQGDELKISTPNEGGLQNITLNSQSFNIELQRHPYAFNKELNDIDFSGEILINSPKSNLILQSAKGFFVFESPDTFFYPFPSYIVDFNADSKESLLGEVSYILAEYQKPIELADGWQENSYTFDIKDLHQDDKRIKFILSAPGLSKECFSFSIRQIRMELENSNMIRDILKKMKQNFH